MSVRQLLGTSDVSPVKKNRHTGGLRGWGGTSPQPSPPRPAFAIPLERNGAGHDSRARTPSPAREHRNDLLASAPWRREALIDKRRRELSRDRRDFRAKNKKKTGSGGECS